jgi:FixJ family two-component response regulator
MNSTSTVQPTVFVVDDDRPMRQSLTALLEAMGFAVRAFSGAGSFRQFYRSSMPGCLLLDVCMPGASGLELYEQLLHDGLRVPVVFMTAHADVSMAVAAMKSGAVEFLEKPFDRSTLEDRVRRALALDRQWRESESQYAAVQARLDLLNDRDRETLDFLLAGESNKAMAARLLISQRAVEMRRARIMRKLGVSSMAELLDLAIGHRIQSDLRRAARDQRLL